MLNVFIGVVIDTFNKMKSEQNGSALMTATQQQWVDHMGFAMREQPLIKEKPPNNCLRAAIFRFVQWPPFDWFIMSMIVGNTILMATRQPYANQLQNDALRFGNMGFAGLFALEFLLKIFGLGCYRYYKSHWNKFDFSLVLLSVVGILFNIGAFASVLRIFRVARLFRLVKQLKGLQKLY